MEGQPAPLLALSWLMGGAVVTEPKTVETPKGTVHIDMNQTWGSRKSIREDVNAAVGANFTDAQMKTALAQLQAAGFIDDLGVVLPETRGRYGKKYAVDETIMHDHGVRYNVSNGYRMFHYGNPDDFDRSEIVVGDLRLAGRETRNRWGKTTDWAAGIAAKGSETPAFTNVGRWRPGEEGDFSAPVYVPLLTIDIDREDLNVAFADTMRVVDRAAGFGYDLSRIFVSFSGRRGFHVQITTDQLGTPIFADSRAAQEMMDRVSTSLTYKVEIDKAVNSPKQLIRLTGSTHEKTGLKKITFDARHFRRMTLDDVLITADTYYSGFTFPNAAAGDPCERPLKAFCGMAEYASVRLYEEANRRGRSGNGAGDTIKTVVAGVTEGESWGNHVGRNKAAFVLACWLLEGKQTGDREIDQYVDIEDAMTEWNGRNDPPLPARELQTTLRSAERTIS